MCQGPADRRPIDPRGDTVEERRRLAASTVTVAGPDDFPKPEGDATALFLLLFPLAAICRHVAWLLLRPTWVANGRWRPANARPACAGAADASVAPNTTARMAAAAQGRIRSMTTGVDENLSGAGFQKRKSLVKPNHKHVRFDHFHKTCHETRVPVVVSENIKKKRGGSR